MTFTTHAESNAQSIARRGGRGAVVCLIAIVLLPGSGWSQGAGKSMLRQLLGSEPAEFITNLDQHRPPAARAEFRARVLNSLPTEGEVNRLSKSQQSKLTSLDSVLRAHEREGIYQVRVIAVPQAFVGLYARSVVLISEQALELLTDAELQALAAHEIGHEYVWQEYESAATEKDFGRLQRLELYCDAVAIVTLQRIGADPANLFGGLRKVILYNRSQFGVALNEQGYPTLASRKEFSKSVIAWVNAEANDTVARSFSLPTSAQPRQPIPEAPGRPSLTVRIYDYAKLSSGYLSRAAEKARHVYRQVGIETRWIQCRVSLDEPVKNPACEAEPGPTVLQMKILPKVMAERFGLAGDVFGFALPPRGEGFGNVARIFHQRVQGLAASSGTAAEVILGHMLAHEAGHLLLGINGHSPHGIMHIPWRDDDLQRAEVGGLKFTRQQAERMRKQVEQRWEAKPHVGAAAVESDSRTNDRTM